MRSSTASPSFPTTRWSVVRRAVVDGGAEAGEALAGLCEGYWYPLYAYFRRSVKQPEEAEDLTQGFFARILEKEVLEAADPTRGKLRTFLLACARNYQADQRDRAQAEKRGGVPGAFDAAYAEQCYAAEPVDHLTPDRLFQRRWALAVLEASLDSLGQEYAEKGKADVFAALRPFLGFGPDADQRQAEVAAQLGMAVGTLKSLVFRLRERWRELLMERVATTLDDPSPQNIKDELVELLGSV